MRPANIDDARILFEWRNDPLTRQMSKNSDLVEWEEHVAWLGRRLSLSEPHLYVAEDAGCAVGTIRIDGRSISYTTAPEIRGRGYATAMLKWAYMQFGSLFAEIKPENIASIRAATKARHKVVLLSK
jgi:RimJ/RimL family protein N-acetyltransferase